MYMHACIYNYSKKLKIKIIKNKKKMITKKNFKNVQIKIILKTF